MANQLRASLYTLVRNWRVWVALGLVALNKAIAVESVMRGVTYGLQDSIFRDKRLIAIMLFAGAAVAVFDQRGGALRSSCLAERGRGRYALSRCAMVATLVLALLGVAALLDVVAGALVPGASVIAASPDMCSPGRVAAGLLTYLVIGETAFLAALLSRSRSALAAAGMVAVAYVGLSLLVVAVVPAGSPTASGTTISELIGSLMPLAGLKADVMFAPYASLIPLDPAHAFVVPLAWLAAIVVLARLDVARRAV